MVLCQKTTLAICGQALPSLIEKRSEAQNGEARFSEAVSEQAIVADANEAFGQDVQEKSAQTPSPKSCDTGA